MLHVVNSELFQTSTTEGKNDYGSFIKTEMFPAPEVSKDTDRRFLLIMSQDKNYNANPTMINTRPSLNSEESGNVNVLVKSFPGNKYDALLFLVAIPFNGLMAPIPESNLYRIHKGLIQVSKSKNIELNGSTYRRILYLLIEPNVRHDGPINISFESYNIEEEPAEDGSQVSVRKTIMQTFTLQLPSYYRNPQDQAWAYYIDTQEVEPLDPSYVEEIKKVPLFTTFVRKDRIAADESYVKKATSKFNNDRPQRNNNQRRDYNKPSNNTINSLGYRTSNNKNKKTRGNGNR